MKKPTFTVGQSVLLAPSKRLSFAGGKYTIIAAMPGGGRTQYRVKGDAEKFERVIDEILLDTAELAQ